ncbi:UvrD-helicase domain-containing protein [Pseudoprimorskyibacter insulae]|uniref:DNA 3'-5' helicase II n=1 Tax=Pseudoprimorskyibacter insulae TaxID=1695997 RepID=A0A2R8APU0_9RHOB|nr:UvrD-helicase domain-containing protein [Pseudoprimorskyibacter insulae]SPF78098.1 DNA helicase II [Pseudoprimorskyibacter insulae]
MIELPEVSDQDVQWACKVLGLPETAFSGPDGADPRLGVLRANATLDVEACPGSGKTTLLVAKLAILARHWNAAERGICVLSHTNAARREIEKKLGATSEGQRLLSYPHYVGTIHGFVNEYLALPWLRSKGIKIEAVDDDVCLKWRWSKLPFVTRRALEQRQGSLHRLRYLNSDFDLGAIPWGKGGVLNRASATYQHMQRVCQDSYKAGLFCHDEMFVWASDLLDRYPEVTRHLRHRFPLLMIDEVQDNSEVQSRLLQRIFVVGGHAVMRQRFGDQNQAIYSYQGQDGAATDSFPIEDIKRTIPNSYRFGNSVAALADPLGVSPHGLVGQGGVGRSGEPELVGRHAIFLLDDDSVERVIDEYVAYLRQEFGAAELSSGDFTAVGAVHRADTDDKLPRSIRHYWPEYDPEISSAEPQPNTLLQYLAAGRRLAELSGETNDLVEKLAEGVLRLARLMSPETAIGKRRRNHRYVMDLLEGNADALETYLYLVRAFAVSRVFPTQDRWEADYRVLFESVAHSLSASHATNSAANGFLAWSEIGNVDAAKAKRNNVLWDETQAPAIKVRVGSIHSVKGETHTATLVLETFYYKHHLKELKPWLLGQTQGGNGRTDRIKQRLRLHYVAMTRAARLLCLAMRTDAFNEAEIGILRENGWRVARVTQEGVEWFE